MAVNNCVHPYLHSVSEVLYRCETCGEFVPKHKTIGAPPDGVELPPRIYELENALWEKKRPWSRIPFEVAKKYGWYISFIYDNEYLIMPISRNEKPVFYSARRLSDKITYPKYLYPASPKVYWTSVEPKEFKKTVGFLEGVADASYVSIIPGISTVALLGSWYDGSLNEYLQDKHIRIMMDGDAKGIEAAFRVMQSFKRAGLVNVDAVILPDNADPTDLSLGDLRKALQMRNMKTVFNET